MIRSITAVFEAGMFRPTAPVPLADGALVQLVVISNGMAAKDAGSAAANILAEIAALPTSGGDPRTSQEHDRILYDEQGQNDLR